MKMGKVIGSVVSTQKHESLVGKKLMVVRIIDSDKKEYEEIVSADNVGAGIGEYVLLSSGSTAKQAFDNDKNTVIESTIVGIIDSFDL
jgi:ethanolamine utilization protein EutN